MHVWREARGPVLAEGVVVVGVGRDVGVEERVEPLARGGLAARRRVAHLLLQAEGLEARQLARVRAARHRDLAGRLEHVAARDPLPVAVERREDGVGLALPGGDAVADVDRVEPLVGVDLEAGVAGSARSRALAALAGERADVVGEVDAGRAGLPRPASEARPRACRGG